MTFNKYTVSMQNELNIDSVDVDVDSKHVVNSLILSMVILSRQFSI